MILITGSTGHLGNKVLRKILENNNKEIYVLINNKIVEGNNVINIKGGLKKNNTELFNLFKENKIDTVIHLASNFNNPEEVYIEGTKELIEMIKINKTNIKIIIVSIVGIEKENNFDYYKIKYQQEFIIKESGLEYAILRTTQWHDFVKNIIENNINNNIINIPENMKFRSIDINEVITKVVEIVNNRELKGIFQIIGPEILNIEDYVKIYVDKFNQYTYKIVSSNNIMYNSFTTGINLGDNVNSFVAKNTWKNYIDKL